MNEQVYFKFYVCFLMLSLMFLNLRGAIVERSRENFEPSINEIEYEESKNASKVSENATTAERNRTVHIESNLSFDSLPSFSSAESTLSFDSKEKHPELDVSQPIGPIDSSVRISQHLLPSSATVSNLSGGTSSVKSGSNFSVSVSFEQTSNTSERNIRSTSVSTSPAVPFTALYQPVLHLENVIQREFYRYLSILKNPFLQKLAQKLLKSGVALDNLKSSSIISDDYLSHKQLRSVFKLSKHAVPSLFRCRQPESTVTIKCISNIARITFTSDSETRFNAKASIYNQNGNEIPLDGYKLNAYIVWWRENKTKSELFNKLTKEKLERKCDGCSHLKTVIKLEGDNHACLIPVTCKQPQNEVISFDTKKLSAKYFVRNVPVITSSMAMHDPNNKDGYLLVEEIPSGNDVHILIQATADTIPVGVFVRECRIITNEKKAVIILINGCSISNLLDNFHVIFSSEKNDKFMTTAKFTPFSMKNLTQNLTLGCFLKICEGMCNIPSCQAVFRPPPQFFDSRIIKEVYLETTYRVLPENFTKGERNANVVQPTALKEPHVGIAPCNENDTNILSRRACYIYLILTFLMCIVLLMTMAAFYFKRQEKKNWHISKYVEEIESTPRTYYTYNSNPRRRSPNSSSIVNVCD